MRRRKKAAIIGGMVVGCTVLGLAVWIYLNAEDLGIKSAPMPSLNKMASKLSSSRRA